MTDLSVDEARRLLDVIERGFGRMFLPTDVWRGTGALGATGNAMVASLLNSLPVLVAEWRATLDRHEERDMPVCFHGGMSFRPCRSCTLQPWPCPETESALRCIAMFAALTKEDAK